MTHAFVAVGIVSSIIDNLFELAKGKGEKTRELLVSLGAGASVGEGKDVWGLIDRVGHG